MASNLPGYLWSQAVVKCRFQRDEGWCLTDMSSDSSGRIGVAGYQKDSYNTFIALYSKPKSALKVPLEIFYFKEYKKYKHVTAPLVSFVDAQTTTVIICHNKELEAFDTRRERVLRTCKLDKTARCLFIFDRKLYIGFLNSGDILVLHQNLEKERTVTLKGLMPEHWSPPFDNPHDIAIVQDKIIVCSLMNKTLSYGIDNGQIVSHYKHKRGCIEAFSITASEENDIVCVLWDKRTIHVYSLSESCHLLTLSVFYIIRIRLIREKLVTIDGNSDISEFDVKDILDFNKFIMSWGSVLSDDDSKRLKLYFGVKQFKPPIEDPFMANVSQNLLLHLNAQKVFSAHDTRPLVEAVKLLGMTEVLDLINNYQRFVSPDLALQLRESSLIVRNLNAEVKKAASETEKAQMQIEEMKETFRIEKLSLEKELNQTKTTLENDRKLKEKSAAQVNMLQNDLQKTERLLEETSSTFTKENAALTEKIREMDKLIQQAEEEKRSMKDELAMLQLSYEKESMGVKELIEQTICISNELKMEKAETVKIFKGQNENVDPYQAVEYGRLLVDVASDLTLDVSLKLSELFSLPASEVDLLRRMSNYGTPGTKLLEILKVRGIINMYDTDNLQKAFALLKQEKINRDLLVPYQRKIDSHLHDLHKANELLTWQDVRRLKETDTKRSESSPDVKERDTEVFSTMKGKLEPAVDQFVSTSGSNSTGQEMLAPYQEFRIGREGGTVSNAGITLSIPEGTFCEDRIIGVGVIGRPNPLASREEYEGVRISPIVYLEPAGLVLAAPVLLTVQHSLSEASEGEGYSLTLHAGFQTKDQQSVKVSDETAWKEETLLDLPITEKRISLEITSFGYFFVSFLSQNVIPVQRVRLLVFVESILDVRDDIFITIIFCSDCDPVYEMLLSAHRSKLLIASDPVMHVQLCEKDSTPNCVDVTLSSFDDTYAPESQESTKILAINQLMSSTGVNEQFKLSKKEGEDFQDVSFKITVSQGDEIMTELKLKTKIKDLLISRDSKYQLLHMTSLDLTLYKKSKAEMASQLSEQDVSMLAHYFGLTRMEKKSLYENGNRGMKLMEILSDKNIIQPGRMVTLFEGMADIYHTENSNIILDYIKEISHQFSECDEKSPRREDGTSPLTATVKIAVDVFRNQLWNLLSRIQDILDDNRN